MRFTQSTTGRRRASRVAAAAVLGAAVGCQGNKLTDVTTPDIVQPSSTQSVAALPAVFNSAIAEFTVAYAGSNGGGAAGSSTYGAIEGEILYAGLLGDEILLSDTFPTRREIDYRSTQLTNANNDGVYRQLQIARVAAERSASAYASLQPNQASQAEAYALAGYTYLMFAENYCGNVPFSTLNNDGTVTPDAGHTTQQILAIASAKFDSAIAVATTVGAGATSQLNLARVGKARALLDEGQYAAAAQLTTGAVPTTYAYTLYTSANTTRQNNGIYSFNRSQRRFSVAMTEGGNGLAYRGTSSTSGNAATVTVDPRVLVVRGNGTTTSGFDGSPLYVAVKYSESTSPALLATGVEARLIEAEAAAAAGGYSAASYASALTILNTLRANTSLYQCPTGVTLSNFTCPVTSTTVLAPLTDPGTQKGRVLQLFQERAFWMFLTSHRLGDMRRLSRTGGGTSGFVANGLSAYGDLTGGAASVFPVGVYTPQTTVNYGSNTSLPVPYSEQTSNPKYNPAACDDNTP